MRGFRLLPLPVLLPGCLFWFHDDDHGFVDDTAVVDSGTHGETGDVPAACDAVVRRALDALTVAAPKGCGHAWLGAAADRNEGEVMLEVYVDTLGGAARPEGPYTVGARFHVDLATSPRDEGFARLLLGQGSYGALCNDAPAFEPLVQHAWLGTSGTIDVVVTEADEATDWGAAGFRADVTLRGVVVEDEAGGACALPDLTWERVSLGWLPG